MPHKDRKIVPHQPRRNLRALLDAAEEAMSADDRLLFELHKFLGDRSELMKNVEQMLADARLQIVPDRATSH